MRPASLLVLILAALLAPRAATALEASASSGNGDYAPRHAIDNDPGTRWSSDFSDDQWLRLDFDEPRSLVGLRIHWETAYGRDYDIILYTADGATTVARQRDGNGGLDDLYFGPHRATALELRGRKRGTGWGYSIWELELLGPEAERHLSASASRDDAPPRAAMDGDPATRWQPPAEAADAWLQVDFPEPAEFGGLRVHFAQAPAPPLRLFVRVGENAPWQSVFESPGGGPARATLFFDRSRAASLRLDFPQAPAAIAELGLMGPNEAWNPVAHFEMLAERLPDGAFPGWLRREQTFWTVSGLPAAPEESLLDEHGRLEPRAGAFSVTPLIQREGRLLTAKDFATSQSLADGWAPLPAVVWQDAALRLETEAITLAPDATWLRHRLTNLAPGPQRLAFLLALRPLQINPPWQHGGFAPVREARWLADQRQLVVNGRIALEVATPPDAVAVEARAPRDIAETLTSDPSSPPPQTAIDALGLVSAGLRYDISFSAPGEHHEIFVRYPLEAASREPLGPDTAAQFETGRAERLDAWRTLTGDWSIDCPDPRLERLIRSNLCYLLINADGPATQPGSRNYDHAWIRDGAISATALLRFGLDAPARRYLDWFTGLIGPDGFVPFLVDPDTGEMVGFARDWTEHDSFGQYAFLVRQYVAFTGDDELGRRAWPALLAALRHMEGLRQQRLTPEYEGTPFHGILPESNSHEGYFPARHSYWDDFWALRGLADGAILAERYDHAQEADWMRKVETQLRQALLASIDRVRREHELDTLPAAAELGDFDPTSTAVALMVADERDHLPADALAATFERYWQSALDRMRAKQGAQYTPYEVRNVSALLRLGHPDRAWRLLQWFFEDALRPPGWNHMAEVVHDDPRTPSYIGDMPHTWVGAGLISAIRDCFVYEERERLVLARGLPDAWYAAGLRMRDLPTWYGPLSYEIGEGEIRVRLDTPPPGGFDTPPGLTLFVNGKPADR